MGFFAWLGAALLSLAGAILAGIASGLSQVAERKTVEAFGY